MDRLDKAAVKIDLGTDRRCPRCGRDLVARPVFSTAKGGNRVRMECSGTLNIPATCQYKTLLPKGAAAPGRV